MDGWTDGSIDTDGCIWMVEWMEGYMDGWKYGWMNGWMKGLVGEWMN